MEFLTKKQIFPSEHEFSNGISDRQMTSEYDSSGSLSNGLTQSLGGFSDGKIPLTADGIILAVGISKF